MSNSSIVIRRRDYSDIVKLQDPGVLESFLDEPLTFIAETLTGALAVKPTGLMVAGGRIVQAVLKAKLFEQWAAEFKKLRDAGRIPDDFAEKKYGFQTWVELMTIIDEDSPDPDRLEALKAMFFAVNQANVTDGERILAYQLWQIAKNLNAGELLLMKEIYQQRSAYGERTGYHEWASHMAQAVGHGVTGLIDLHEKKLAELGLITPRHWGDLSGINPANARMTTFGERFCKNIETYRMEIDAGS